MRQDSEVGHDEHMVLSCWGLSQTMCQNTVESLDSVLAARPFNCIHVLIVQNFRGEENEDDV